MSRLRYVVLAIITAASPITFIAAGGVANAAPHSPGQPCSGLHATTQDANGRTMWCEPPGPEFNVLLWQYGGPS
ncbi:hypothetical protein ACTXG5_12355 [Mycobacterium sp. Dal123C01]|uniref:hypothetical protein n=1 Tax=Mycobacterium sp. Dal123C01 TaxID=3457577 RepID=UPI00403E6588